MAAVASEDIVASGPGKQHFDTVLPRQPGNEEDIEGCGVRLGLIQVINHGRQLVGHLQPDLHYVQIYPEMPRHHLGIRQSGSHALM